jgi:hypothetical protein
MLYVNKCNHGKAPFLGYSRDLLVNSSVVMYLHVHWNTWRYNRYRERWKSLCSISGLRGGWSKTSQPWRVKVRLAVWGPVIFSSLDPLGFTWSTRKMQQTPTWTKLSLPAYRHLIDLFHAGIQTLMPRWDRCLNVTVDYMEPDVHHLLPDVYFEDRIKLPVSDFLLPYSFNNVAG